MNAPGIVPLFPFPLGQALPGRWVAWPGCAVEKTSQEGVRQRLEDDFNCRPVFLERDLVEAFYARLCHGVLWPLFHSLPTDVTGRTDLYEAYVQANQKYLSRRPAVVPSHHASSPGEEVRFRGRSHRVRFE